MENERPASPPPLLAYTASHQREHGQASSSRGGKKAKGISRAGRKVVAKPAPYRRTRETEPVVFDESARHDYLTGFRKRKQARIENGRKRAAEREKEQRRAARAEARKARQEQAAENVRMEKIAYGPGEEEDEDEEDDDEDASAAARDPSPSAYETEEHQTTVTVQAWDPEAEAEEQEAQRQRRTAAQMKKLQEVLPPSSRRAAKKMKSAERRAGSTAASRNARAKVAADAQALSRLLTVEETPTVEAPVAEALKQTEDNMEESGAATKASAVKKKPGKFHYESKLERAKAKAKIREDKIRFAERRKAQRLEANKTNGKQRARAKAKRRK